MGKQILKLLSEVHAAVNDLEDRRTSDFKALKDALNELEFGLETALGVKR
ncbi:MAG: hypothetical protein PHG35_02140 [Dehalococcoidales bacterium]|nr:hypothetical protein [Dehalococcoidales bacterium]